MMLIPNSSHRLATNRALILPPSSLNRPVTAITTTVAVKTTPLLRLYQPLRSFHTTRPLAMDRQSPSATSSSSSSVDTDASPLNNEANSITHRERKTLPPELSRIVLKLTCDSTAEEGGGVCDVYLVGTAHVSEESCQEVQAVISFLKPEVVFLELCSSRTHVLRAGEMKVPTTREMLGMLKNKHNPFGVARSLEVFPGAEFRVAFEEALKYGGKVVLGDRPFQITLRRTWGKMPLRHKAKLLYQLLFQSVFLPSPKVITKMLKEMDDVDMLTLVTEEMSEQFPTLMETLVHERDQFMSATLLKIASKHNSVVAVVGKGHLAGIQKNWKQPIDVMELLTIQFESNTISVGKVIKTVGVATAGIAILSGIYLARKK